MYSRTSILRVLSFAAILGLLGSLADAADKPEKKKPAPAKTTGVAIPSAKLDQKALSQFIDTVVSKQLENEKLSASPLASDSEFLRRVYLDITGKIPTADQAAAFLDSKDADKRAKLIDTLLASSDYGRHQADTWQALMLPRNSDNRRLTSEPLVKWLEEQFNSNKPWDQFVTDLITSTGPQDKNGAVTYFLANGTVDKITDSVTKLFCGVQLQCAQCHNHPFTDWKQTEYWHMAAFFMKVQTGNVNKAAKEGTSPEVSEAAMPRRGKNALPESAKIVPPKFLQGEQPTVAASAPYRPVLAKWLTAGDNQFFAKAMVNRTWGQLFGRGFVNPIDDMHEGNAASHPELLQGLTHQFVASGFDLKFLIRAICNSEAYQRSSKPTGNNTDADATLLSRMNIKVLTPEQMYDSLTLVLGSEGRGAAGRQVNAGRAINTPRAAFVAFFALDDNADPTEFGHGIPQALRLMNAPQMNNSSRVTELTKNCKDQAQVYEKLYLSTLSRRPTEEEVARLDAYVKKVGDTKQANIDLLWALVNSSEFTLNH